MKELYKFQQEIGELISRCIEYLENNKHDYFCYDLRQDMDISVKRLRDIESNLAAYDDWDE